MNGTGGGALDWLEIVFGFTCNCRCRVCPSPNQPPGWMEPAEVERLLHWARRRGASGLWLGGGEPTLYPRLVAVVGRARELGFSRVRLQSNGLRLAYPDYVRALADAGVDQVALMVAGAGAEVHDHITRRPGAFSLLLAGLENCLGRGLGVDMDVLVTQPSCSDLERLVQEFTDRGVRRFTLWWASGHGLEAGGARELLPAYRQARQHLSRARALADRLAVELLSLHTPFCVLAPADRSLYRPCSEWRLFVATPGQEPFPAESSPMEGGAFLPGCSSCSRRRHCLGPRADYLELFGPDEFVPL